MLKRWKHLGRVRQGLRLVATASRAWGTYCKALPGTCNLRSRTIVHPSGFTCPQLGGLVGSSSHRLRGPHYHLASSLFCLPAFHQMANSFQIFGPSLHGKMLYVCWELRTGGCCTPFLSVRFDFLVCAGSLCRLLGAMEAALRF